jgi:isopenicillin-N N-acyltransferase-like protein
MRAIHNLLIAAALSATLAAVLVVGQTPQPTVPPNPLGLRCPGGYPTPYPVNTDQPKLIATVPTGKLYLAGQGNDTFYVQHVYGSYYDMGLAHGQLHIDRISVGLNRFYDWLESQIEEGAPWLPAWIAGIVADFGVQFALELTWNATKPFTPQRYVDEMQGIADGALVNVQDIFNINMIAELIKAQCSVIGANGKATMKSLNGTLVHLRTLDGMGGATMPIKDYAVVTVYHPSPELDEPVVANFAWVSFVGTVTGFSETVGVGEKYWGNQPDSDMTTSGEAWTFVTRDMLSAKNFSQAIQILETAHRTCALHLGIGGYADNSFLGAMVDYKQVILVNDSTVTPYPQHPYFEDIVYWDKYSQPTSSYCFADLFTAHYGEFTAELLATNFAGWARTGDLHAAVFDYAHRIAFFSNARKSYSDVGSLYAYHRQFTQLDMQALFDEQL